MSELSKDCDHCKGIGKNPKKRKQICPVRFCGRGKVPLIAAMCDCECHETPGIRSFAEDDCCIFSGSLRKDIEKDPNYNPPPKTMAELEDQRIIGELESLAKTGYGISDGR